MRPIFVVLLRTLIFLCLTGVAGGTGLPVLASFDQSGAAVTPARPGPDGIAGQYGLLRHDIVRFAVTQAPVPSPGEPPVAPCVEAPLLAAVSTGPGVDPGRRWDLDGPVPSSPATEGGPACCVAVGVEAPTACFPS